MVCIAGQDELPTKPHVDNCRQSFESPLHPTETLKSSSTLTSRICDPTRSLAIAGRPDRAYDTNLHSAAPLHTAGRSRNCKPEGSKHSHPSRPVDHQFVLRKLNRVRCPTGCSQRSTSRLWKLSTVLIPISNDRLKAAHRRPPTRRSAPPTRHPPPLHRPAKTYPKTRAHTARIRRARSARRYEAASASRPETTPVATCSTMGNR